MRRPLAQVIGCGFTAAALVAAMAPPAAAAATRPLWVISSAQVEFPTARATVVTLIQVCPGGAVLDRKVTLSNTDMPQSGQAEGNARLLYRKLWPAGMVTRWKVIGPGVFPEGIRFEVGTDVIYCRVNVSLSAARYVGRVKTIVRLWGPVGAHERFSLLGGPTVGLLIDPSNTDFPPGLPGEPMFESFHQTLTTKFATQNATATVRATPPDVSTGDTAWGLGATGRTKKATRGGSYSAMTIWSTISVNPAELPVS